MAWEFQNDRPIYTQLLEKIQVMIISGKYRPGERLPAVRELAMEAAVNPNTMQRAMAELERQGLVYSQRTSGRMVTDDVELIKKVRRDVAVEQIKEFVKNMEALGFTREEIIELINKED